MVRVLSGSNDHKISQRLKEIVATFRSRYGDSIERFDGSELESPDQVLDAVRTISLLDENKLVIIRDFTQCKGLVESIEEVVKQTAESTELVLVSSNIDKRSSYYKYLQKNTEFENYVNEKPLDLAKWIVAHAKDFGSDISFDNAKILIDRVGANQQLLSKEIEKLSINSKNVSKENIVELTEQAPQGKVFDMLDALFKGDGDRAWRLYQDQRKQGEEPQKVIAMITWQLQQLAMAVFAPKRSSEVLVKAGMSPYTAQKSLATAKNISKENVKHYITQLAEIDLMAKTNADVESALSVYFADISARQATS